MADIFICYRRDDSSGHAGRLYDRLVSHFGGNRVFFDIDNIGAGEDFVAAIDRVLQRTAVVLAIIGRNWLVRHASGRLRLSDRGDYVRLEIAAALKRKGVKVIPVLVHDAQMPRKREVPAELQPLLQRNAVELRDRAWSTDVSRLIRALERLVGKPTSGTGASASPRRKRPATKAADAGVTRGSRKSSTADSGTSTRKKKDGPTRTTRETGTKTARLKAKASASAETGGAGARRKSTGVEAETRGSGSKPAGGGRTPRRTREKTASELPDTSKPPPKRTRKSSGRTELGRGLSGAASKNAKDARKPAKNPSPRTGAAKAKRSPATARASAESSPKPRTHRGGKMLGPPPP